MEIDLTDKERFALAMQFEMLDALKPENGYGGYAQSLLSGHKWLYKGIFTIMSENLSDEKAQHVLDVLDLFSDLKYSFEHLDDKSGIEEREVHFPGFDGNNEPELLGFAKDLLKYHRYETVLQDRELNSHSQTTEIYKRMLVKWLQLGRPRAPLPKETIQDILAARRYPGNR
ncbi:hypothetical protein FEMY_20910 [Ferrovum myxofaciens]|uniref:YfbU family protein n=1 Tax=Ferrovum myxofaciens TaxID=416213 RepID=A0A149VVZ5_9PROT|nr:YfbU family protein [Ferrovum myxofaciens]KXW57395.1 hypothetical protein FEMY_20910 [Ferrovum myxofaciens]